MKADAHPLRTIFGKDIRYAVPLYQRPYVWTKEEKWEPLWEDIRVVADLLVDGSADSASDHFLGAVVLEHRIGVVGDLELRYVIDGQQRLTTLQLLIAAAASAADEMGCDQPARVLRKLTANDRDLYVAANAPDLEFKVWPTNRDRDTFR